MTRFLKKNFLTERRAKALEILGPGELTTEIFVKKMWGATVPVNFGAYFLAGLMGLGLVEKHRNGGGDTYGVSEEGKGLLAEPTWKCWYCGAPKWKSSVRLYKPRCRACNGTHQACNVCTKTLVVADGEFPTYRAALRQCPPVPKEDP